MTNEARGRGEPGSGLSLTLETTLNQCNLKVLATVLFRKKHAPSDQRNVIFALDGDQYPVETTDEFGRVMVEITLPGPGNYRLVAFLAEEPGIRVSRIINIEEPAKPKSAKAVKISVRVIGRCGTQMLFVYAIAEDGSLVPGAKGIMMDGDNPSTFKTDENGMFIYAANFAGQRTFRVRIGENDINNKQRAWKGVLQGK